MPTPARAAARAALPFARALVALEPDVFDTLRRTVALLFRIAHTPAYAELVDVEAGETARHRPGNTGVFMGYDFHLTAAGPRLIEINTNAGGALANGLHTASLCRPEVSARLCADVRPVEEVEGEIVASFRRELEAVRPGARLRRMAIADERPREQFLHPEFELLREILARAGIEAEIADTGDLRRGPGGLLHGGRPLDLVYLRDTDFLLGEPRTRELRSAYLAGEVVVTPPPREHHLLANKRRLVLFSSREALARLGVAAGDVELLTRIVPETRALEDLGLEAAWRTRRDWVFKPAASFASRAVYRGDKLTRRKLEEIAAAGGFVAQRRVDPGEIEVETADGPARLRFDVRVYAYRDEVLLLGARTWHGQVTNLRTPGGGFTAICVARR